MAKHRYIIRPLDGGFASGWTPIHAPPGSIIYPSKNFRIEEHSAVKRWGYSEDRDLSAAVLGITIYQQKDGTRNTMYLTGADLCLKETGGSNTFSYKTETLDYDDTIASITDAANSVVTGKAGTTFITDGVVAGDMFILDDDHSSQIEKDSAWLDIKSVDSETQLTLNGNYADNGTTGSWGGSEKSGLVRLVYTTPSNEYPWWAIVDDKFCFGNGNIDVQNWAGSGYASALDSTNAKEARYGIEFTNRLVLADLEVSGTRDQLTVQWSKEGDPTDWTDTTAGSAQLLQSTDYITGLGRIGPYLMVYKKESYHTGIASGEATSPIFFPRHRRGIGLYAPYSLIHAFSTNYFLGETDFYQMIGDMHESIGENIRDFFFSEVTKANAENVVGFPIEELYELHWIATTSSYGVLDFVYNLKTEKWYIYDYNATIKCGGRGST